MAPRDNLLLWLRYLETLGICLAHALPRVLDLANHHVYAGFRGHFTLSFRPFLLPHHIVYCLNRAVGLSWVLLLYRAERTHVTCGGGLLYNRGLQDRLQTHYY